MNVNSSPSVTGVLSSYAASLNYLHNGGILVDQRFEGAAGSVGVGAATIVADRWQYQVINAGSGTPVSALTYQQVADAPAGFLNSIKLTVGTASGALSATDRVQLQQNIEGPDCTDLSYGTSVALPISISFLVKSSVAGTYFANLSNSARTEQYSTTFSIPTANTWTQIQIANIPGDITGTWLTAGGTTGLTFRIGLGGGATCQPSALNTWQTVSAANYAGTATSVQLLLTSAATFQMTGAKIESGNICTPFVSRPYQVEHNICRRYYRKSFPEGVAPAQNAGVAGAVTVKNPIALGDPSEWIPFDPPMAATPTITTYNPSAANANWRDITASADATVSVDPATTIGKTGVLLATSGTVATLGDILAIHYTAGGTVF